MYARRTIYTKCPENLKCHVILSYTVFQMRATFGIHYSFRMHLTRSHWETQETSDWKLMATHSKLFVYPILFGSRPRR